MARDPIPSWYFAVTVVRRDDRFLLVHERKHGQLWYLPAGRVEPGETFEEAALRETLEETGVPVDLVGILRIEHRPTFGGSRMRVVYLAEPIDDTPPKSEPDDESLEARWVSLEELPDYPLRGQEVRAWFEYVAAGPVVHPLEVVVPEGVPVTPPESP